MSKFKLYTLISTICMLSVVLYSFIGFSQSPQASVRLISPPQTSQILPFEAGASTPQYPAKLTLQAVDSAGKPLENTKFNLKIFTPPKTPWFTTDFPIVEGTKLLDIETIAPKGQLQLEQMLPIRGNYQLNVNVTPLVTNAFTPIQQTLTLSVAENSVKYRNFGILAVVLLIVGLGGGWVIGGRQEITPGEIAPQRVRLLLSGAIVVAIAALLFVNLSAEIAQSESSHTHTHDHHDHHTAVNEASSDNSGIARQQGLEVQLLGSVSATVGEPAGVQVKVIDQKTNQPAQDVLFNIKTTMLEDGWVSFAHQGIPNTTGEFTWEQGFFDGAPHKVEVEVAPQPNATRQFTPFLVQKIIDVEGVAPPLTTRLISLAYMTAFVIIGLLIGLRLRQNFLPNN
ncbi:MAG: hypothetical protein KME32_11275 [Mojavia pulchra JT2-VF2]|jgi:hypothetical protein|uniref:Uncharacterized protein n=1 Tax=Mojavia pulchra JT2-VF2 TaxID=287848 RepID=A0A951PXI8_9NOST|nr:hypothetical protein [Mojavia pulchra JT2-VF2]